MQPPSEINIDTTWKQSVAVYYSSTGLKEMLQKPEELWCLEVAPHLRGHIWFKCVSAYENKLQLRSVKEGISMLTAAKPNRWWWKVLKSRATFYSCTTIAATKPWTQNLKMAAAPAIFLPVCSGVYKHAILPGNIFFLQHSHRICWAGTENNFDWTAIRKKKKRDLSD